MNWDAISAIGEIVGAVAVVISLVYVAVQIRQNTRTIAANTFQSVSGVAANTTMQIAQTPHLSRLVIKIFVSQEQLTPEEMMDGQLVFGSIFRNYENYCYQYSRGYFEEEVWDGYKKTMSEQLSVPFGKEWWNNHQAAFGKSFVTFVNAELLDRDASAVPWVATQRGMGAGK